jgi:hypothetical protein
VCDPGSCSCTFASPIVIDTTGEGFHLTSAGSGVDFDILGDGYPVRIAWTAPASRNAFLALDRNHNGKIDSGKELFGNLTDQPQSKHPNGFLALAEFDKPENGGNGDGIIDAKDDVFSHLLLWIDENHDGISQPNELHTLPELGVYSINLRYRDDKSYFDVYGNWFHYQSTLNPDTQDGESKDGRFVYDVFFMTDINSRNARSSHLEPQNHFPNFDDAVALLPRPSSGIVSSATAPSSSGLSGAPFSRDGQYRFSLNVENNRIPRVQLWNDSNAEITAVAVTIDLSDDLHQVESRTYYDVNVNYGGDLPIFPRQSRLIPVGYVAGRDVAKLSPKVRAVVFSNGASVGEQVWIDAIMARRKHLYTSLVAVRGLLAQRTRETSTADLAERVRAAKREMHGDIPLNEFRAVDDLVFDSAVRTLRNAKGDPVRIIGSYVKGLETKMAGAKRSMSGSANGPEVVPPHLDGQLARSYRAPLAPLASMAMRLGAAADHTNSEARPRLVSIASLRPATATYSCSLVSQNNPVANGLCDDPPTNNYPTADLVLSAVLESKNSQTGATSTTTFSTSGTAVGMCEYYVDCDGDLVNTDWPPYADPSGGVPDDDGTAQGTAFWWVLSNYGPAGSGACDCEDPDPYGTVWENTSGSTLTPTFWVAESGNTTSNCAGLVRDLN